MLIPALGDHPPADIEGVNVPKDLIQRELETAVPRRGRYRRGLASAGLGPWEVEVVQRPPTWTSRRHGRGRGHRPWRSSFTSIPRVLTVADTEYGRISFATTTVADGTEWLSIWPTTPAGLRQDLGRPACGAAARLSPEQALATTSFGPLGRCRGVGKLARIWRCGRR